MYIVYCVLGVRDHETRGVRCERPRESETRRSRHVSHENENEKTRARTVPATT